MFRPEIVPSIHATRSSRVSPGKPRMIRQKGNTMRLIPFIRSLLFALVMLAMSAAAFAQIGISVSIAPPALPVYEQPPLPAQGYIWTPGYWAYSQGDYYWVPGTWVMAPQVGFLWTPGYWGWGNGGYAFNEGYWGPHVGFYGGINYGYGYTGQGYQGGRWDNGQFAYNRAVNNVNVTNIHNTYNTTVINNTTVNRISYNGGTGGITARPTAQEEAAVHEKHIAPVAVQTQHAQAARANPQQRVSVNQGKPAIAATPKPGAFSDRAAVPAKEAGAPYKPAVKSAAAKPSASTPVTHAANSVPRPGTAEKSTAAPRNDVPRPPSASEKASTARPAGNTAQHESTPRPQTAKATTPKPENAQHTKAAPQKAAPRPESTPRAIAAARPENAPHPQAAPRPAAPRPESTPHPQAAARPENAPHAQAQPHQEAAARPQAEAHPAEKESRPEERRP